jgi:capsular exopolysaccharide synthesis family protein
VNPVEEGTWAETFGQVASEASATVAEDFIPAAPVAADAAPAPAIVESPSPVAFDDPVEKCGAIDIPARGLDPHLAALVGDDVLARERYNTLAVRLVNLAAKRNFKTILVTSAAEGEGKTTVAINLAAVLAKQSERKVLLIDGDLRRNSVARTLGIKPAHGWVDLAEGRCQISDAVVRLNPGGLYVLADCQSDSSSPRREAGRSENAEAAVDLLTSTRAERLLKELEQSFQFVIFDAPSILDFAESQRLASMADGTVLVVRAGRTNYNAVGNALKLVPKERRIGVVLNQSTVETDVSAHKQHRSGSDRAKQYRSSSDRARRAAAPGR